MKGRTQALCNVVFQTLQRLEPKMFGKREENRVSVPQVLSMRAYEHMEEKHDKKGLLVKTFHLPL